VRVHEIQETMQTERKKEFANKLDKMLKEFKIDSFGNSRAFDRIGKIAVYENSLDARKMFSMRNPQYVPVSGKNFLISKSLILTCRNS